MVLCASDCHNVGCSNVKSVCLGAVSAGENWESHLTHVVATTLNCLDVVLGVSMVCVEGCLNVGRAIASAVTPTEPVCVRVYDLQWLCDVMRWKFVSQFGDLDPFGVPDFLKFQLSGVIADHRFDKMPELLRRVGFSLFVSFVIFALGLLFREVTFRNSSFECALSFFVY